MGFVEDLENELEEQFNSTEQIAKWFTKQPEFTKLMTYYESAMMEIETKLNVLNKEFSLQYERNPFEQIESRLKNPISIIEKMKRRGYSVTVTDLEKEIFDVAGIRVVCSFIEDIYKLADLLESHDDVVVVQKKDYIKNPKPNGYRSLHLILDVPIYISTGKKYMKVEVQFRTIAMDFWASLDHKLKYKKEVKNADEIAARLKVVADNLALMDAEMQGIRHEIDNEKE